MWNGTMFADLDWPLNASSLLSASAELLVMNMENEDLSPDLIAFLLSRNVGDECIARFVENKASLPVAS